MSSLKMSTARVFVRALPGGGFVAIDVMEDRSLLGRALYRGALIVERRANGPRTNSAPPVIARAIGKDVEEVIQQLLPTAQCNPAIGAAMLRHEPVVP
jgi:hypothetical protein